MTEFESGDGAQLRKDTESLKLYKKAKGYDWEIKILEINVDRLEEINEDMKKRFGNLNAIDD